MTLVADNQFPGAMHIERRYCQTCGAIWEQMVNIPDTTGVHDVRPIRDDCTRCGSHLTHPVPGVLIL